MKFKLESPLPAWWKFELTLPEKGRTFRSSHRPPCPDAKLKIVQSTPCRWLKHGESRAKDWGGLPPFVW